MQAEKNVKFIDLGLIDYKEAWDIQTQYAQAIIANKRNDYADKTLPHHYIIFCQHPNVYTLGKSGSKDNLLLSEDELDQEHIDFYPINRGGDITYHGPGQLVVYPIFDLDLLARDVHLYVRNLEAVIIEVLAKYNVAGTRIKDYTGVWIEEGLEKRKICAIGVHLSRWVSMHGLAFNVAPDLKYFNNIIPCGIVDKEKSVTTLKNEINKDISMAAVMEEVKLSFENIYKIKIV